MRESLIATIHYTVNTIWEMFSSKGPSPRITLSVRCSATFYPIGQTPSFETERGGRYGGGHNFGQLRQYKDVKDEVKLIYSNCRGNPDGGSSWGSGGWVQADGLEVGAHMYLMYVKCECEVVLNRLTLSGTKNISQLTSLWSFTQLWTTQLQMQEGISQMLSSASLSCHRICVS